MLDESDKAEPVPLDGLDQILQRFEHFAVRAKWNFEGAGVWTLDKGAENVKAASRELRKALAETGKIKPDEDRTGAIIRTEGPCTMKLKDDTRIVVVALHGDAGQATVAGLALPERTLTHVRRGEIRVEDGTTAYFVLLGR